jgi:hypothetical protein
MVDWAHIQAHKLSNERPHNWPEEVRAISVEGLSLFGIHETTGRLYWDGRQVRTRRVIQFGKPERWIAGLAAAGIWGGFLVGLVRLLLDL